MMTRRGLVASFEKTKIPPSQYKMLEEPKLKMKIGSTAHLERVYVDWNLIAS